MARIESAAKMGTYPLDDWRADQLISLVKNTGSRGRILDPFCDTGHIVKRLGDAWNMEPYGIEIKEDAARQAQNLLGEGNVIWADAYTGVIVTNAGFDILYLNPPYDVDYSDMSAQRAEYKGLRDTWKYLRNGGLAIWVAYKHHISTHVAKFFFEKCKFVYPFYWEQPHLDHYTQICLIGLKKDDDKKEAMSPKAIMMGSEHLKRVGTRKAEESIPIEKSRFIEMSEGFTKSHPFMAMRRRVKNKKTGEVRTVVDRRIAIKGRPGTHFSFSRKEPDPKLTVELHTKYGPQTRPEFKDVFRFAVLDEEIQPIAKPRAGQLGVIMAFGLLDNATLTHNGKRCMIRGSTKHKTFTARVEEEIDQNNNEKTIITEHTIPTPTVTVVYEDGKVENLTDDDSLVEFIKEHMDELFTIYREKYEPSYDMEIDPMWGEIFDNNLIKGQYEYLPTQEYIAVCAAEHLMRQRKMVIVGEMSIGKAQPLHSKVLTPSGWKLMGEITVGDFVIGVNGEKTKVIAVTPQGKHDTYRITFTDESQAECNKDHLWQVNTPLRKWKGKPSKILTLQEIMDNPIAHRNGNLQHFIPIVNPIEFEETVDHLISPYILGALIGDGCLTGGYNIKISNPDEQILSRINNELPEGYLLKRRAGIEHGILSGGETPHRIRMALEHLKLMGKLSYEKFIPDSYKYDSLKNRIDLLNGLMDTDGTVCEGSTNPTYTTTSKQLAHDVQEIVRSLGGIANINSRFTNYTHNEEYRQGRKSYRLTLRLPESIPPFYLKRKADKYSNKTYRGASRAIKKIERVGKHDHQCITVSSNNGLYITDDYIVTHNSAMANAIIQMAHKFEEERWESNESPVATVKHRSNGKA